MARVSPETDQEFKYNVLFKLVAILTMPIEGAFFFGTIMGWPNLAELYKQQGVYQDVCSNKMIVDNSTLIINCNERDELFSWAATLGILTFNSSHSVT